MKTRLIVIITPRARPAFPIHLYDVVAITSDALRVDFVLDVVVHGYDAVYSMPLVQIAEIALAEDDAP